MLINDSRPIKNKSEIGEVPSDWDVSKLEELVEKIKSGGTPKSTKKEYYNGKIPFVKIEDITLTRKYLTCTKTRISEEGLNSCNAWLVPEGSLLYSIYATVGEVVINKIPVATNQAILNIIPNRKINAEYLYYFFQGIKNNLNVYFKETTQKNLTAQIVKDFRISVPPVLEQQKIASILSKTDKQIEQTEQIIATTELLRTGLMQYYFNPIKMRKWSDVEFKDIIVKLKRGHSLSTNSDERGVIYLTSGYLKDNSIDWSQKKYLDTEKSLDNCLLEINDLILNCVNSLERIGKVALFKGYKEKVVVGFNNFAIKFDTNKIQPEYAMYYCLRSQFQHTLKNISKPAVQQVSFSGKDLQRLHIQFPSLQEQQKIASILSKVDSQIQDNQKYLSKLQELKKGLMQDLLTGKVRVTI